MHDRACLFLLRFVPYVLSAAIAERYHMGNLLEMLLMMLCPPQLIFAASFQLSEIAVS